MIKAVSLDCGFELIEVNPSQRRSGHVILDTLGEATQSHGVPRSLEPSSPRAFAPCTFCTFPPCAPSQAESDLLSLVKALAS